MSRIVDTYAQYPFCVTRAKEMFVYAEDGTEYLDLYGGHAVAILGHSREDIAEALYSQAKKLLFYSNAARMEVREEAAQSLISFAKVFDKVFFCNSGAEANENALKLAVQKTGRSKIASFYGGWHGRTLMASNATDDSAWHKSLKGWLGEVVRLEPGNNDELGKIDESVACVILEPIQSIAGVRSFSVEFLQALRARCSQAGTWLIFDEVQTGVGRVGVPYVSGGWGVVSDISTSAKSLANGVPIGAVLLNEIVANTVNRGDLGSTFGGSPLAMVAMNTTLTFILEHGLINHAQELEKYCKDTLVHDQIEEITGAGCLLGIRFKSEAKPIQQALIKNKILTGTSGHPHVLRLLMPLVTSKSHIDRLNEALQIILNSIV